MAILRGPFFCLFIKTIMISPWPYIQFLKVCDKIMNEKFGQQPIMYDLKWWTKEIIRRCLHSSIVGTTTFDDPSKNNSSSHAAPALPNSAMPLYSSWNTNLLITFIAGENCHFQEQTTFNLRPINQHSGYYSNPKIVAICISTNTTQLIISFSQHFS